jgi:hypothetical protein
MCQNVFSVWFLNHCSLRIDNLFTSLNPKYLVWYTQYFLNIVSMELRSLLSSGALVLNGLIKVDFKKLGITEKIPNSI